MLGFSPYSATAFSDLGTTEQLFVATGVVGNGAIGTASVTGDQIGLTLGSVQGSGVVNDVSVDAGATATFSIDQLNGSVNPVIASTDITVSVSGVGSTGSSGSVTATGDSDIALTGLAGTTNTPSVSTTSNATFSVTGVSGAMSVGTVQGQAGPPIVTGKQ